jgi:uncharacterized protein involved in exopolysaccharide biosynthesis
MVRAALASTPVRPTPAAPAWVRLVRLAATGLVAGAAAGFLAALLRPRRWIEYAQPPVATRP